MGTRVELSKRLMRGAQWSCCIFSQCSHRHLPLLSNELMCSVDGIQPQVFIAVEFAQSEWQKQKKWCVESIEQKSETWVKLQEEWTEFILLLKNLSGLLKSYWLNDKQSTFLKSQLTGINTLIELCCKQNTIRENVFTSYSYIFSFLGFLIKNFISGFAQKIN